MFYNWISFRVVFNVRFKNEDEAWEWWEEAYYFSGGGYEPPGHSFDMKVNIFRDWVEDQGVTYLDEELSDFIDEEWKKDV